MQTCERIGIFGAGTMGHSIALSAAWAGHTVNVWGSDEAELRAPRKIWRTSSRCCAATMP